jgi:hypothetical protein
MPAKMCRSKLLRLVSLFFLLGVLTACESNAMSIESLPASTDTVFPTHTFTPEQPTITPTGTSTPEPSKEIPTPTSTEEPKDFVMEWDLGRVETKAGTGFEFSVSAKGKDFEEIAQRYGLGITHDVGFNPDNKYAREQIADLYVLSMLETYNFLNPNNKVTRSEFEANMNNYLVTILAYKGKAKDENDREQPVYKPVTFSPGEVEKVNLVFTDGSERERYVNTAWDNFSYGYEYSEDNETLTLYTSPRKVDDLDGFVYYAEGENDRAFWAGYGFFRSLGGTFVGLYYSAAYATNSSGVSMPSPNEGVEVYEEVLSKSKLYTQGDCNGSSPMDDYIQIIERYCGTGGYFRWARGEESGDLTEERLKTLREYQKVRLPLTFLP